MRRRQELLLTVLLSLAFALSLASLICLFFPPLSASISEAAIRVQSLRWKYVIYSFFFICLVGLSLFFLLRILFSDMTRTVTLRKPEIGEIDLNMDAVENIALNATRTAQAGIKQARARASVKSKQLSIHIHCSLYSDVEIPVQMENIQERVKKEIERYTGLAVHQVYLTVDQVELIHTGVRR
ncbi:MAG: alkaline shock response membrane anchor protein AmaP [Eubacteriales bacterium]|nr:alkaline shock response membrane anchor protein AmaP [Eubacteriales bacterium]